MSDKHTQITTTRALAPKPKKKVKPENIKQIGITLKGEDVDKFNAIKKSLQLKVDALTVRMMIRKWQIKEEGL